MKKSAVRSCKAWLLGICLVAASPLAIGHGAPDISSQPEGLIKIRITSVPDRDAINALILDAPRPGILLSYQGEDPITVLGSNNEPMLRFSRTSVEANSASPTWQALPNVKATNSVRTNLDGVADEHWVTLSNSGSFGWLDPRLAVAAEHREHDSGSGWSIPIRTLNDGVKQLRGRAIFEKVELAARHRSQ